MKKKIGLLVLVSVVIAACFSCGRDSSEQSHFSNLKSKTSQINTDTIRNETTEKNYLSRSELNKYVQEATIVKFSNEFASPFDSLKFDKVIAYDFDGREERYSKVFDQGFAPVILRQKQLTKTQIDFLLDFLTDPSTYGEPTAACFEPHLGIVFYKGIMPVFEIDICMDCNYLNATMEIPATQSKKVKLETGESYGLNGFSASGKAHIIEISKQLHLDYGRLKK